MQGRTNDRAHIAVFPGQTQPFLLPGTRRRHWSPAREARASTIAHDPRVSQSALRRRRPSVRSAPLHQKESCHERVDQLPVRRRHRHPDPQQRQGERHLPGGDRRLQPGSRPGPAGQGRGHRHRPAGHPLRWLRPEGHDLRPGELPSTWSPPARPWLAACSPIPIR